MRRGAEPRREVKPHRAVQGRVPRVLREEDTMFERIRTQTSKTASRWVALGLLTAVSAVVAHAHVGAPPSAGGGGQGSGTGVVAPVTKPRIEATFVLDTTGSMSGLIEGAKQKIWTIASEMANAQERPEIRLGLIAYRDRGDEYVTRRFPLSPDADALYATLQSLVAAGGGDGPESVNQALHEAVTQMGWTTDPNVYRVIFLVGDAPPHMDYDQDVSYVESAQLAAQKGIRINTVQCGADADTTQYWQKIASLAQGEYAKVAQDGAMVAIHTPVDDELARLNATLADTALPYGAPAAKAEVEEKLGRARAAAAPAAASRLSYLAKRGGGLNTGSRDLVDALASGDVALDAVPADELPDALRDLDRPEQERVIAERAEQRRTTQSRIDALVAERDAYLSTERARREASGEGAGFDDEVLSSVREQAASAGIHYEAPTPTKP
jgi:uncharacterized protein YegL